VGVIGVSLVAASVIIARGWKNRQPAPPPNQGTEIVSQPITDPLTQGIPRDQQPAMPVRPREREPAPVRPVVEGPPDEVEPARPEPPRPVERRAPRPAEPVESSDPTSAFHGATPVDDVAAPPAPEPVELTPEELARKLAAEGRWADASDAYDDLGDAKTAKEARAAAGLGEEDEGKEPLTNQDFGKGYKGWATYGTAFGKSPYRDKKGKNHANSFAGTMSETATGTLVSDTFTLGKSIEYDVHGGKDIKKLRVEVVVGGRLQEDGSIVGGKVIDAQTGNRQVETRAKHVRVDTTEYEGETARVRIVDGDSSGRGVFHWIGASNFSVNK